MAKVGVLLSGCGVFDGAEIHESVLALLALNQRGAQVICCAPNIEFDVTNHLTKDAAGERRNALVEAARIARGDIRDAAEVTPDDIDALVIPGGFGAAKNLCNFAEQGPDCDVDPTTAKLISGMLGAGKPIGVICIAPALLARIAGDAGSKVRLTIGTDRDTAAAISKTGCVHQDCGVTDIVIDADHKIVSTPAYMLGKGPAQVHQGIDKLVEQVLKMI